MTAPEATVTVQIEVGRYSVKRHDAGVNATEVMYPLRADVYTESSPQTPPLLTVLFTAQGYEANSRDRKRAPDAEELTVALKQAITTIPNLWTWFGSALRAIVLKIDEAEAKAGLCVPESQPSIAHADAESSPSGERPPSPKAQYVAPATDGGHQPPASPFTRHAYGGISTRFSTPPSTSPSLTPSGAMQDGDRGHVPPISQE